MSTANQRSNNANKKVGFKTDGQGDSGSGSQSRSDKLKVVPVYPAGDQRNSNADELYKEYQSTFGDMSAYDHFGYNGRKSSFMSASRISIASLQHEPHLLGGKGSFVGG